MAFDCMVPDICLFPYFYFSLPCLWGLCVGYLFVTRTLLLFWFCNHLNLEEGACSIALIIFFILYGC